MTCIICRTPAPLTHAETASASVEYCPACDDTVRDEVRTVPSALMREFLTDWRAAAHGGVSVDERVA